LRDLKKLLAGKAHLEGLLKGRRWRGIGVRIKKIS
jgi:hypothetical protein